MYWNEHSNSRQAQPLPGGLQVSQCNYGCRWRFFCSWNLCNMRFLNIQKYYDHIKGHVETKEKGKDTKQSRIRCKWANCTSTFPNVVKSMGHPKSHSDEKLLACPNCGSFFSNRTRFFRSLQKTWHIGYILLSTTTVRQDIFYSTFKAWTRKNPSREEAWVQRL